MVNVTIVKYVKSAFIRSWRMPLSLYIGNQEVEKHMQIGWLIIKYLNTGTIINYFYNAMIEGQINDGDPENIPGQAGKDGKGFADSPKPLKKYPEDEVQSLSEAFTFYHTLHISSMLANTQWVFHTEGLEKIHLAWRSQLKKMAV